MMPRMRQGRLLIRAAMKILKQFTIEDLQNKSGASRSAVQRYVNQLVANGNIVLDKQRRNGKSGGNTYCLVQLPLLAPQKGNIREDRSRAWTTMQILRCFRLADLEMCTGISADNAKKYVQALLRTEYLRIVHTRLNGSNDSNVYCLVRDSGPLAPIVRRDCTVFDPNNNQVFKENN